MQDNPTARREFVVLEEPVQKPMTCNPIVTTVGAWDLGYEVLCFTLGNSQPVPGFVFYIKRHNKPGRIYVCFSIKEAVAHAERCHLPAKLFGKFMAAVYEREPTARQILDS